ncbi:hypothetical protein Tco_0743775 [Tanacetum coccineum]
MERCINNSTTQTTSKPLVPSTNEKCSTNASRSKPQSETKNHRIMQPLSSNQKSQKIEAHTRNAKPSRTKENSHSGKTNVITTEKISVYLVTSGGTISTSMGVEISCDFNQNRRDLPSDIPLVSVEVLRYEKRSKSENKGKVPTEMELVLEQTQQGTSYEVSIQYFSWKSCQGDILTKLNLPDTLWILKDGHGGVTGSGGVKLKKWWHVSKREFGTRNGMTPEFSSQTTDFPRHSIQIIACFLSKD